MEFTAPDDETFAETSDEHDWTVVAPTKDVDLQLLDEIKKLARTEFDDVDDDAEDLITHIETDGDTVESLRIDFEVLWKLAYEHRRYRRARGFSSPEMQVLHALDAHEYERVGVDEILEDDRTDDISESMVYKALRNLQDKDLAEKVRPGLYRYTGP